MTVHIPADVLTAARTGDPEAVDRILDELEPHIAEMARERVNSDGGDLDELTHAGRIATWKLACEWDGAADEFPARAIHACEQAMAVISGA